jgi:hypothetical protein
MRKRSPPPLANSPAKKLEVNPVNRGHFLSARSRRSHASNNQLPPGAIAWAPDVESSASTDNAISISDCAQKKRAKMRCRESRWRLPDPRATGSNFGGEAARRPSCANSGNYGGVYVVPKFRKMPLEQHAPLN